MCAQKLRVECFTLSADGFGAGTDQDIDNPLGRGGFGLHEWMIPTDRFQKMIGNTSGETGMDNDIVERGFDNVGAWIMGRNMFGPIRGPWPDDDWKGWWGEEPPYHCPVFVLTHHARDAVEMAGGTVFHFVTDGIESALEQAKAAAGGRDVRLGGGVQAIRQYLEARLVDSLHLAVSPVLLGAGEHLFAGLDLAALGYECTRYTPSPKAAHYVIGKRASG
ncbi:MAG TPA: dihydrofolate reductase family protein [Gammaproteobacteria bacterium]|nr:dihydrofolate reductase family protein [Gammaproteobacteria bacterium]